MARGKRNRVWWPWAIAQDPDRAADAARPTVLADGTREWYRAGKLHREDGPAVEDADGTLYWYRDDKLHREDGPAVERPSGTLEWHRDGHLHREDGPAIEHADGKREWYLDGEELSEDEFEEASPVMRALIEAREAAVRSVGRFRPSPLAQGNGPSGNPA